MRILPQARDWKPWRRLVRQRVQHSAVLRRDFKQARKRRISRSITPVLRALVPLAFGAFASGASGRIEQVSIMLILWTVSITFVRAAQIVGTLKGSDTAGILYALPVSDEQVFAHQRNILLKSSIWLGIDWLFFGLALASEEGEVTLFAAAFVMAFAQWATCLAVASWVQRRLPIKVSATLFVVTVITMIMTLKSADSGGTARALIDGLWRGFYAVTPPGWMMQIWMNLTDGHPFAGMLLVAYAALAGFWLKHELKKQREGFDLQKLFDQYEQQLEDQEALDDELYQTKKKAVVSQSEGHSRPEISDAQPANFVHRELDSGDVSASRSADLSALSTRWTEQVTMQETAGHVLQRCGVIERSIGWFLTQRQRALADFLQPETVVGKRSWLSAGVLLVIAVALRFSLFSDWAAWPAAAAIFAVLPVLGGSWAGFKSNTTAQVEVGNLAYVPAGFAELSKVFLKINAIQCVAAFPVVVLAVGIGFSQWGVSVAEASKFGLAVVAVALAAQPVWLMLKLSSNTNDSTGRWYAQGLILGILLVTFFGGVTLGVGAFASLVDANFVIAVLLLVFMNLMMLACLTIYGLAWNRGWFDLLPKPN